MVKNSQPSRPTRSRGGLVRAGLAASLSTALIAGTFTFGAGTAFAADDDVIPDAVLKSCINTTYLSQAADAPISVAQLQGFPGTTTLTCGSAGTILDFEGLQHSTFRSLSFTNPQVTSLTPLGGMQNLTGVTFQGYKSTSGVVDLEQMVDAADTIKQLQLNISSGTTKEIKGLHHFSGLTDFRSTNGVLRDLPGLDSLSVDTLFLNYNRFDESIFDTLSSAHKSFLNLSYNHILDFSRIGTATSRSIHGQRAMGSDVLLKSADRATTPVTAKPADLPKPPAGSTVHLVKDDTALDTASQPVEIERYYQRNRLEGGIFSPDEFPDAKFQDFSAFSWYIDTKPGTANDYSWVYYPTAVVDITDQDVTAFLDEAATPITPVITYSVEGADIPTFTPTSYSLASGTLPAGLTFNPQTGIISGTPTAEGTFEVVVQAVDANNVTVNSTVTVKVEPRPTAADFTVIFEANDGTDAKTTQTANAPEPFAPPTFDRPGYSFTGWNTAADGSGTPYTGNESFDFTANLTLFAQWTKDAVTPEPKPDPSKPTTGATGTTGNTDTKPATGPALAATGAAEQPMLFAAGAGITLLAGAAAITVLSRRKRAEEN